MIEAKPNVTISSNGEIRKYKNNMVQTGFDWLVGFIVNDAGPAISHIAIGDNPAPVSLGDVQLQNELARKAVSLLEADGGNAYIEVFMGESEANFHWKEIGLFAGGTDMANTGTLIARAVIDEDKNSKRTATVSWEIGFANA